MFPAILNASAIMAQLAALAHAAIVVVAAWNITVQSAEGFVTPCEYPSPSRMLRKKSTSLRASSRRSGIPLWLSRMPVSSSFIRPPVRM